MQTVLIKSNGPKRQIGKKIYFWLQSIDRTWFWFLEVFPKEFANHAVKSFTYIQTSQFFTSLKHYYLITKEYTTITITKEYGDDKFSIKHYTVNLNINNLQNDLLFSFLSETIVNIDCNDIDKHSGTLMFYLAAKYNEKETWTNSWGWGYRHYTNHATQLFLFLCSMTTKKNPFYLQNQQR